MTTPLSLVALLLAVQTQVPDTAEPDPATVSPAPPSSSSQALYAGPLVRPFEMPRGLYDAPGTEGSADPTPEAPVGLDAYARSYEGPKSAVEQSYERGVRGAFDSAQVRMGGLDGQWSVTAADGAPLMILLLNDPGDGELDGAWRDLKAGPGAVGAGLLETVRRDGSAVVMQFYLRGARDLAELRVRPDARGRYVGTLRTGAGSQPVVMGRS